VFENNQTTRPILPARLGIVEDKHPSAQASRSKVHGLVYDGPCTQLADTAIPIPAQFCSIFR
jgi:hypothetical protein